MPTLLSDKPPMAESLAMAIITASSAPLLLIDSQLAVITASRSFCVAFGIAASSVGGQPLSDLGSGEWGSPKLRSLLEATLSAGATIEAYEMDLVRKDQPDRLLILNAQKLDYVGAGDVRLLLAIADVTDARISEKREKDRLAEKDILLREMQHRVANSLQIIASVLMQSARRVQSAETRGHLHDAHHRVLSVAAVQSHLATAQEGDVKLRAYLTNLCQSMAASMIPDPEQLSLEVRVDDSVASADTSMSLGLIVTELVINTLKHAFPDQRSGAIVVDYHSEGTGWILSVRDDGVGMPGEAGPGSTGLGTSIVDALARKLGAKVAIGPADPGTMVSVSHP